MKTLAVLAFLLATNATGAPQSPAGEFLEGPDQRPGTVLPSRPMESGSGAIVVRAAPLELTLRQAIELSLRDNLHIRIERDDLEVSLLRIEEARGYYDPRVGVSAGSNSTTVPATSALQGTGVVTSSGRSLAPLLEQNLPLGGSLRAAITSGKTQTTNPFSSVDPLYASQLSLTLLQPLLRGSLRNPAGTQLRVTNLRSKMSASQFRQLVSEVVLQVHLQYWTLVYALEVYKARQESNELAVEQLREIEQKVQAGLLTPVAVTSARAEVASREQESIGAQVAIASAQNNLKVLLAGDPSAPIWNRRILPTDHPRLREIPATLGEAIQTALHDRAELQNLVLQLKENELQRSFLRWETRPQLNLIGNYGSSGAAGVVFQPVYDPNGGVVPIGRVPLPSHPAFGDYHKAWNQVFDFTYPDWTIGLNLSVPIFNRTARARLSEADIGRRQLETRVKLQQQVIMVEVTNAYDSAELQRKSVEVARLARELSKEQLDAETSRFGAGFTTHFEVVRYQRDLTEARVRELRARIDYELALAALQKAMDTIVGRQDLLLAESSH